MGQSGGSGCNCCAEAYAGLKVGGVLRAILLLLVSTKQM